jgi:hypothetical protein
MSNLAVVSDLPPCPEGMSAARKAVWTILWRRFRCFEAWPPAELKAMVDEFETLVQEGAR